ncbi:MAG: peptidylprolyl isomerase [Patescibacteria group bacterium]
MATMKTKTLFYCSLFVAGLAAFGLGCNPSQSPVSLDKYQQPVVPGNTPLPPVEQATSTPPTVTSTQPMVTSTVPAPTAAPATTTNPNLPPNPTSMEPPKNVLAFPGIFPDGEIANKQVRVKTDKGDIVFELLPQEGPRAASNFYYLAIHKFYDGLIFHRVEPGFVIQGGDPLGTGTGGPGYQFEDDKVNLPYKEGIVAMANSGPNTNGSQFFIMLADWPSLPPSYSVFGRVVSGMDVVKKIAKGDKMVSVTVEPLKK